jgi:hypothetical protein
MPPGHCSSGADHGGDAGDYQGKAGLVSASVAGFGTNPSPRNFAVVPDGWARHDRRLTATGVPEPRLVLSVAHGGSSGELCR